MWPSCVEWIAHRGASRDAPENTLVSMNLAWQQGADAVEVDVFLSKDNRIVAVHDDTTKRTGGLDRRVADQTLAELKNLDVGAWKDAKWTGERIPALEELLAAIPGGKRLFMEIKCGREILPELEVVLRRSAVPSKKVAIVGMDWETVKAVRERMPGHEVYWVQRIERDEAAGAWNPSVEELVTKALKARLHGLDVKACAAVDAGFVKAVKKAGLRCFAWTVNDPGEAKRLIEAGVEGITTDCPGWLREKMDLLFRTP